MPDSPGNAVRLYLPHSRDSGVPRCLVSGGDPGKHHLEHSVRLCCDAVMCISLMMHEGVSSVDLLADLSLLFGTGRLREFYHLLFLWLQFSSLFVLICVALSYGNLIKVHLPCFKLVRIPGVKAEVQVADGRECDGCRAAALGGGRAGCRSECPASHAEGQGLGGGSFPPQEL